MKDSGATPRPGAPVAALPTPPTPATVRRIASATPARGVAGFSPMRAVPSGHAHDQSATRVASFRRLAARHPPAPTRVASAAALSRAQSAAAAARFAPGPAGFSPAPGPAGFAPAPGPAGFVPAPAPPVPAGFLPARGAFAPHHHLVAPAAAPTAAAFRALAPGPGAFDLAPFGPAVQLVRTASGLFVDPATGRYFQPHLGGQ